MGSRQNLTSILETSMPKISLEEIEELSEHKIIMTTRELLEFIRNLRQDYYSPEKVGLSNLLTELNEWLVWGKANNLTFFAVDEDKDEHARNAGWGGYTLYRCIVVRTADDKLHFLKTKMREFSH